MCAPLVLAVWRTNLKAISETRVTGTDDAFCRSVSVPSTQHTWRWSSDCNSTHWLSLCQKQISGSGSITSPKQTPNSLLSVVVPADMTYAIKAVRNTPRVKKDTPRARYSSFSKVIKVKVLSRKTELHSIRNCSRRRRRTAQVSLPYLSCPSATCTWFELKTDAGKEPFLSTIPKFSGPYFLHQFFQTERHLQIAYRSLQRFEMEVLKNETTLVVLSLAQQRI